MLLQVVTANVCAQVDPFLDKFTVVENNGKVYLNWTISSGRTCKGTQIYRSTDGINYFQIGKIDGICGSSSSPVNYDYTDDHPIKNKVNYYRLELGGNGTSESRSVEYINFESGYQVRPNPIIDKARVYFENKTKREHQLSMYTLNGIQVFTTSTNDEFFEISTGTLISGMYLFAIFTDGNVPTARGKLVVQ